MNTYNGQEAQEGEIDRDAADRRSAQLELPFDCSDDSQEEAKRAGTLSPATATRLRSDMNLQ